METWRERPSWGNLRRNAAIKKVEVDLKTAQRERDEEKKRREEETKKREVVERQLRDETARRVWLEGRVAELEARSDMPVQRVGGGRGAAGSLALPRAPGSWGRL